MDPRYLGFFECFNRQFFFEAHEVLEGLWLLDRNGPNGAFYKGLIQLAGAFVHIQKNRPGPAAALFNLARANLSRYPTHHEQLAVEGALALAADWTGRLNSSHPTSALLAHETPRITLEREDENVKGTKAT
jgi:predicted metal-dependent hydrolase